MVALPFAVAVSDRQRDPHLWSKEGTTKTKLRTLPESQGHDLALTVFHVPNSLDSGTPEPSVPPPTSV